MVRNKVIIVTTGWFPEGDAGAVRLSLMGRALVEAGFDVTVLCRGKLNSEGSYYGVEYFSLRNIPGGCVFKAIDYVLFPAKLKKYLKSNMDDIYAIYIYNAHTCVFEFCKKINEQKGIKLIHDCVEWYSPEEFSNGNKNLSYKEKNLINTKIIDDHFSVIAISKYLELYFAAKNIHTIRIPILCDSCLRKLPKEMNNSEKLVIFYGGFPIKKDLVGNLLEAALLLGRNEQSRLKIIFVGADRSYLVKISGVKPEVLDSCSSFLDLYGKVSRKEALAIMEDADFSFLARDGEMRYAQAGFPSKVVEALSNATPMLCNISSDLGDFLVDGQNSIIARSHLPEDIAEAIKRAMNMSKEEKNKMSGLALRTAKLYFNYRNYIDLVSEFIRSSN